MAFSECLYITLLFVLEFRQSVPRETLVCDPKAGVLESSLECLLSFSHIFYPSPGNNVNVLPWLWLLHSQSGSQLVPWPRVHHRQLYFSFIIRTTIFLSKWCVSRAVHYALVGGIMSGILVSVIKAALQELIFKIYIYIYFCLCELNSGLHKR